MSSKPILLLILLITFIPYGCSENKDCDDLTITTTSLPKGKINEKYSAQIEAVCVAKFKLDSGELPPGIKLSEKGKLSGTPTKAGSYGFGVKNYQTHWNQMTGSSEDYYMKRLSITVEE